MVKCLLFLYICFAICAADSALAQLAIPRLDNLQVDTFQPGDPMFLKGAGFGKAIGSLSINGKTIAAATWDDTEVSVAAPLPLGDFPISVCPAAAGTPCSNAIIIHIQAPHLNSLQGPKGFLDATFHPGDLITLHGAGFGRAGSLLLNGKFVPAATWNATEVLFAAPETLGYFPLKVCPTALGVPCSNLITIRIQPAVTPADTAAVDRDNGILVGDVSPYRDATLQTLLNAAQQKLAGLQLIDQAGIAAHLGMLQGANYNVSGFGLSAAGPSLPGVQTTANTGNTVTTALNGTNLVQNSGQTVTTTGNSSGNTVSQLQVTGPSAVSTTNGSVQGVLTSPSTQTVTNQAAATAPTATVPTTSSYTLPSSFSGSASDLLNEQLQTNAEIAGYVLLLDGSLHSRFMTMPVLGVPTQGIRTRVTLGVPIDIRDAGKYTNAVAEVIVTVQAASTSTVLERPIVDMVLPANKTYNVASIVDHSVSLSGGLTTGVASVGATWLWGHKTYYIVKDQDTIAFQMPVTADAMPAAFRAERSQSFGWQFRPVLGAKTVTEGWRQVYAQLSFPTIELSRSISPLLGEAYVTTRWRRFNPKTGAVGDVIANSISSSLVPFPIEHYDLAPQFGDVNVSDNGDATVTVLVSGSFLNGTNVQVGAKNLSEATSTVLRTPESLQFSLSSIDAAMQAIKILDSSGASNPLLQPGSLGDSRINLRCFTLDKTESSPLSASSMLVKLKITVVNDNACGGIGNAPAIDPVNDKDLVAVVGNKVFGLRDAPFVARAANELSIVVPSDLLRSNPQVTLTRLLGGDAFSSTNAVAVAGTAAVVSQAVPIGQTAAGTQIALIGTDLSGLSVLYPPDATVEPHNGTAAILTVPSNRLTGLKQIVLKDGSDSLVLVAVPASNDVGPSLDAATPIQVGSSGRVRLTGKGLASLQSVTYQGKPVQIVSKKTDELVLQLPPEALAKAGTPQLEFVFSQDSKVQYPLNIFSQQVRVDQAATTSPK